MIQVTKIREENQDINFSKKLISHRLRGLDFPDASENALLKIIDKNIRAIEFDLRITKDNQLVINHDAHLKKLFQSGRFICELTLSELTKIPHKNFNNSFILTFNKFCEIVSKNSSIKLICIDVKESGAENEIVKMLDEFKLKEKCVIISWLPEVLFRIHEIDKIIPLCLSHYPSINKLSYYSKKIMAEFIKPVFEFLFPSLKRFQLYFNKYNETKNNKPTRGYEHEHFVFPHLKGELLKIISASNGWVCVPYQMTNLKLIEHYHREGIKVCLFTLNKNEQLKSEIARRADFILTDNANLFFTEL